MIHPFEVGAITEAELTELIDGAASEGRTLEFKLELPGRGDAQRKEFLADVTSFANAQGGVILYGLATRRDARGQDTGVAEALPGLPGVALDQEIQRLEAMLRTGVDPPLTAQVRFQAVERPNGEPPLLAVAAFRSYSGPHQVTHGGSQRFWVRGHTGKYQPNVAELRRLFMSATTWLSQADAFRTQRLARVRATPGLDTSSVATIHLLPLAPPENLLDFVAHESVLRGVRPLQSHGWSGRFNADGFMTYSDQRDPPAILSYTQWFRTGGAEGFSSQYVGVANISRGKVIWLSELRMAAVEWVTRVSKVMEGDLAVDPPFALLLSLEGVKGAQIPSIQSFLSVHGIDWDELSLPPVLFDPGRQTAADAVKPLVDMVAQSAGVALAPE